MLVSTYWPYYSEMEYKENCIRGMTACVRKVYGNDKNIIHLGERPPGCRGPRLQPTKPIGKSGTDFVTLFNAWVYSIQHYVIKFVNDL
jgi:hypothetical protein